MGFIAGPVLAGFIMDLFSLTRMFYMISGCFVLSAILIHYYSGYEKKSDAVHEEPVRSPLSNLTESSDQLLGRDSIFTFSDSVYQEDEATGQN